ncbi:MAG: FG-GAP-like repeat-containing protein [bacterium]|nr:FG-GAP-like repeat-containing protein [bacterium]
MKKFILSIGLLCIFASTVYAGTLEFAEGIRIKSHLLSVSSRAVPIVIDYNYDGLKDLIIGDKEGYIWFYENFGSDNSPTFGPGFKLEVSGESIKVNSNATPFVVNWDNTNDIDLIVGSGNGELTLFTSGAGAPTKHLPLLRPGIPLTGITSHTNATPFVCDWNDDTKKDLIIGDAYGNIWVYLNSGTDENPVFNNNGSKVFLGTNSTNYLDVGNDAIPRVVEQWDGVGNKDLVVGNSEGEVYVFLSGTSTPNGTPTFTTGTKIQTNTQNIDVGDNATPFIVNWDNSGEIDLLVGEGDGSLNLYLNSSSKPPVFSISSKIAGEPKDLYAGSQVIPCIINWDNDAKGLKDLIVGDEYGKVKLYLNSGNNTAPKFTDGYTFQVNAGTQTGIIDLDVGFNASPYVYDWNKDNIRDLIVGDENGWINIFINSGNDISPIFKPGTKATTGSGTNQALKVTYDATPIMCDWDNDGDMDMVVGDRYGNVTLFLNSGTDQKPVFTSFQKIKADNNDIDVGNNAKPYVVDYDKDGKKDLVVGNSEGCLKVYLNIGADNNPVFTTQQPNYFQLEANSNPLKVSGYAAPIVMDWNNDNILDLIVGEKGGYINLYTGSIRNSPPKVLCDTPPGTQSKEITINYFLKDDENDVCSILVTYSKDGGINWATATKVVNAGDKISNLNSSKEGVKHSFVWDSKGDLGGSFVGQVIIKIIPNDGQVEGKSGQTNSFWVNNANPPPGEKIKLHGADLNLDNYSTPIVTNWNEDKKRDLLIGSENGYVYFCENVGTDDSPRFDSACPLQVGSNSLKVNNYSSPFVDNWDHSGDKDLLVGDGDGYVTFFKNTGNYLNLASGEKIKVGTKNLQVAGNAVPVVTDWDNDGYSDLIVGDGNGHIYLYLNDKTSQTIPNLLPGVKIQANSDLDVGRNAAPYVIDWDGDNKDDLIIGNSDGYVFYYKNIGTNGTPTFNSGTKIKFAEQEIKVDANSRPCVLNKNGNNIDLLIGSKAGYVFLYRLTDVNTNTAPQITITNPQGTQTTQTGSVSITYILKDDQWQKCSLKVEYSQDGQNWYSATGTPKTNLESSSTGIEHTFVWFSDKNVSATLTYVYLRFIPNDGLVDGSTATVIFYLRNKNNLPMVTNVLPAIGKLGYVEISYDLQDIDNDLCQVLVEYQGGSVGNKWATATVNGTVTMVAPGTGSKLTWLSAIDEKNQKATYTIRITPKDIGGYGTSAMSMIFTLDNTVLSTKLVKANETPELIFSPTKIKIVHPYNEDVLITVEQNPQGVPGMNTLASLNDTVRKITAVKLSNTNQSAPPTKAKITIDYTDIGSYETEILLRIFELRENKWILVEGNQSVDVVNNSVTAEVEHFSVFRIGLHTSSLANFKVYPNPFKDNDGDVSNGELNVLNRDYIVFEGGVSKVEIYTIAGELVRQSPDVTTGVWTWDLKNDYGRLVGSGIYIYVVKDSTGASLVGKVGVIR